MDSTRSQDPDDLDVLASHHLRNPISAIRWSSDLLLDGDLGELTAEQQHYVRAIAESNQRLREAADALIDSLRQANKSKRTRL